MLSIASKRLEFFLVFCVKNKLAINVCVWFERLIKRVCEREWHGLFHHIIIYPKLNAFFKLCVDWGLFSNVSGLRCGVNACLFPCFLNNFTRLRLEANSFFVVIKVIWEQSGSVQNVSWTTIVLTSGDQVTSVNTAHACTPARVMGATVQPA